MKHAINNIILLLLLLPASIFAQQIVDDDLLSLRGTVIDKKTKSPIPFAHVTIKGYPIGVNSNEEGNFDLKLEMEYMNDTLQVSAMGYVSRLFLISEYNRKNDQKIALQDTSYFLDEVYVLSIPAKEIVNRAVTNIQINYPQEPYRMTGFYRTSFKENGKFVRLLESALDVYDEGFNVVDGISVEHKAMRKSNDYRKYQWIEEANYLSSFFYADFVRNPDGHLRDLFGRWKFEFERITYFENEEVFVISAKIPVTNHYEDYYINLYIRIKDYAIMQMEYKYHWDENAFPGTVSDSVSFNRTDVYVKSIFREYRGKLYLSYQSRKVKWHIKNLEKKDAPQTVMEIYDEMMIHKIRPRYRKQPEDKISEYGDIYKQARDYDKRFWRRYNKPVETELFTRIKYDLEKEEPLEKQFKRSKIEDVW